MKKILGMGNALVDIMIPVNDYALLDQLKLPKGSMQLVDKEQSSHVLSLLKDYKRSQSAGGSVANAIHGIATLGGKTGYIGAIGEDDLGGFFVRDMINAGVEPHLIHSKEETGRAITLVTPDSERTFATYLGAASELSEVGSRQSAVSSQQSAVGSPIISSDVFSRYEYFLLEGFLVFDHNLVETTLKLAKTCDMKIAIDLASYNVVEANREFLYEMIEKYVDIVFANEEEAKAFSGKEPMDALKELSTKCDIAVVKIGSKGSLIMQGKEIVEIQPIPAKPIDTTGAGDLYAAGFLYGLSMGMPLRRCGEIGAILAGNVIEVMGSKMTAAQWDGIRNKLNL
jgi:sugar/nucleoside kinase (ribokinase family)